jgi:hypothetical protein
LPLPQSSTLTALSAPLSDLVFAHVAPSPYLSRSHRHSHLHTCNLDLNRHPSWLLASLSFTPTTP